MFGRDITGVIIILKMQKITNLTFTYTQNIKEPCSIDLLDKSCETRVDTIMSTPLYDNEDSFIG